MCSPSPAGGRRTAGWPWPVLVRALALGGKLYLLDEPFTGVDGDRIKALMAALKELGAPVVLSSHEGLVRSLADQVINLDGPPLRRLPGP